MFILVFYLKNWDLQRMINLPVATKLEEPGSDLLDSV